MQKRLCAVVTAALRRSFGLTEVLPALEEKGDFILGIYGWYCLIVVSPEISDLDQETEMQQAWKQHIRKPEFSPPCSGCVT